MTTVFVLPTTEPGFKINEMQDNYIILSSFEKNLDKVDMTARGFCEQKEKRHQLNIEESRKYHFPTTVNVYRYDCVTSTLNETSNKEEANQEIAEAAIEQEEDIIPECLSNIFIGQEQQDGSWKTI